MLRALSSPNLDIRRKTLDIALDLITSRNIDEVRKVPFNTCSMTHWKRGKVMHFYLLVHHQSCQCEIHSQQGNYFHMLAFSTKHLLIKYEALEDSKLLISGGQQGNNVTCQSLRRCGKETVCCSLIN